MWSEIPCLSDKRQVQAAQSDAMEEGGDSDSIPGTPEDQPPKRKKKKSVTSVPGRRIAGRATTGGGQIKFRIS